jgi:hypothetical protein
MNNRPAESLKQAAIELAALICNNDSDHVRKEELFKQLIANARPMAMPLPEETKSSAGTANAIGIWNKKIVNGKTVYKRDSSNKEEQPLWADTYEIGPKKEGKRIVLLGESAARGYFYDPLYNVAQELSAVLSQVNELKEMEVIDLAKTNLYLDELLLLAEQCTGLQPDAVIIFAGNNWINALKGSLNEDIYKEIAVVFEQDSFTGVKTYLEKRFETIVVSMLQQVESLLVKKGIPVVLVIPEYNLADWKSDDVDRNFLWLKEGLREEWLAKKEIAEAALQTGNYAVLQEAALRMVIADPSNPYSHELLGEYYLHMKEWEKANACLEDARDTTILSRGLKSKPRCFRVVRDTILAQAENYGIQIVDLPAIFRKEGNAPVPGRELFLDYCHLTIAGIKLAMRHTAQAILTCLNGKNYDLSLLKESPLTPGNTVLGVAHFCAAIHNAHYGQPAGIIKYHCSKALQYSDELKNVMLQYVDFSTRETPTKFCKTFEDSLMEGLLRQYEGGMGLPHPKGHKVMDVELVDAIIEALAQNGVNKKEEIRKLRFDEHGVGAESKDLLQSYYSTTHYNEFIIPGQQIFKRIRTNQHVITFVTGSNDTGVLDFSFSFRTPAGYSAEKKIFLSINETENKVAALPMSKKWGTHSFRVNAEALKEGVNQLIITWPYSFEPFEIKNEFSLESLLDAMYPVIGEIFSLKVKMSTHKKEMSAGPGRKREAMPASSAY